MDGKTPFELISQFQGELKKRIIGQDALVVRLFVALLADGHLLVEGAPGLAKTTAIKVLAQGLEADFHRVQFTPDLLPGDLTGTDIYRPQDGSFQFQQGPLFHNLLLADEINRAPAKVQSALLEAMGERQITVGRQTYPLPRLFLVMATQNPLEQEGTYPLPEAQLDRFLMYVRISYPNVEAEKRILRLARDEATASAMAVERANIAVNFGRITQKTLFEARSEVLNIHLAATLEEYIVQLVVATRDPTPYGADLKNRVRYGASPRATIALERCARAYAWMHGRDFVAPEDIQTIAHDVLRHRIALTYEAQAEGITTDHFVSDLLKRVSVP